VSIEGDRKFEYLAVFYFENFGRDINGLSTHVQVEVQNALKIFGSFWNFF
jgi:hypothetical protein